MPSLVVDVASTVGFAGAASVPGGQGSGGAAEVCFMGVGGGSAIVGIKMADNNKTRQGRKK